MGSHYDALLQHLNDIHNLRMAAAVLDWDRETAMPEGAAASRATQLSVLARLSHEKFVSEKTAELLEKAEAELNGADYDSDEASMVRIARRDYDEAVKLPSEFVAEMTRLTAMAHGEWAKAREAADFAAFRDTLKRIVDMKRQEAEYRGGGEHPYDALLREYEYGMTTAQVKEIFESHKPALVELIAAINEVKDRVSDAPLRQPLDIAKQREFALSVIKAYGFDFSRGMQAESVHPFCTHFSRNDVRITTRFDPNHLNPALFGMMHEAGHGLYEQGVAPELDGTILDSGTSLGVHESQSRLWENIVGRSKGFWKWALPQLRKAFPGQFDDVDLETFYRAINKVEPSFIRVEADEATYNLHIMVRFELEQALLVGDVQVEDLPEAWNAKFESYLGIVPPNDALGCLQDVHWSVGLFGYFPTYALGNLLSAQYYAQAVKECPEIPEQIEQGEFSTLLSWLNDKIHRHGRKFTADELTQRITGQSIQADDYIQYLKDKFGEVYSL
ncbi:MAG: carboxypeptidase M32 [Chloroflexi bacterium]|nr:MAG: carboxypeptidase M32 [Chloroflexota bacterium]